MKHQLDETLSYQWYVNWTVHIHCVTLFHVAILDSRCGRGIQRGIFPII